MQPNPITFDEESEDVLVPKHKEPDPQTLDVKKSEPTVHRVSVTNRPSITESAHNAYANGRFQVKTHLPDDRTTGAILNELFMRGGILVAYHSGGRHEHLTSNGQRRELGDSIENSDFTYATQRPRLLSQSILQHLDNRFSSRPGERILLLMPESFELQLLTEMERVLERPLEEYRKAHLDLHLSRGGHLRFILRSVEDNQGQAVSLVSALRFF